MLTAAVSSDIDTLQSLYGGIGCRRPGGYTDDEFRAGLETFSRFLERYRARATLFMVGRDLERPANAAAARAVAAQGHEIANHSLSHPQGFRWLPAEQKEREIAGMEERCRAAVGVTPVGFRAPGWNIGNDALPILERRGYTYESSVFPTSLTPVLKALHRRATRGRVAAERTTLGPWRHMFAPVVPYRMSDHQLATRGGGLVQFPITVTPVVRWPFFATFLLATGPALFRASYAALRATRRPIQFQFHLSDFVDFTGPDFSSQVPRAADGVYVPQSLSVPLSRKLQIFERALDLIAADYSFITLAQWAERVPGSARAA